MEDLIRAITQLVGNKRYLSDVRAALAKLDLTPREREAMRYLTQDINQAQIDKQQAQHKARSPWIK